MVGHPLRGVKLTVRKSPAQLLARARRGKQPWLLEGLEDRILLAGSPTIYTVNSTGNGTTGTGDSGTLPYVIGQSNANTNAAGSKIQFDPSVFGSPQTILLSSTLVLSETTGPEVINGPGTNVVTVSGNNAVQVFAVDTSVTATITGLTIASGSTADNGGGIHNSGTLTVADSAIDKSSAKSDFDDNGGGGIYNAGKMTVSNSTIDNNVAESFGSENGGGGIYNTGEMTINNSIIENNEAGGIGAGGGLFNGGMLTVTGSSIEDNYAANVGGGFYNLGTLTVTSSFTDNNGRNTPAAESWTKVTLWW